MKFLPLILLVCSAQAALADTRLVFDDGSNVLIREGSVLFGDDESGILYSGSDEGMAAIEWREETYMVIDEEFTAELSDQLDAAMAQMEAQLAQLPPEQRDMMRNMLKDRMPGASGEARQERSYRATGRNREVAGFRCSEGEMLVNGKPEHLLCTATAKELGMPREDYAALRAAFAAMMNFAREFRQASGLMFDLEAIEGVPISSKGLSGDDSSDLVSVDTSEIAAERLMIPEHFRETDLRQGF